jgi:hypothetical protein
VSDLPSGTVTFLFTDIEGSTRLLHASWARRAMPARWRSDAGGEQGWFLRSPVTPNGYWPVTGEDGWHTTLDVEGVLSA